jgi:hypothetical protein
MSAITFDLPASDEDLVDQVTDFVEEYDGVDHSEMLLKMARKYRFAGYIGTISHLFKEVKRLQGEVDALKKKQRWGWF